MKTTNSNRQTYVCPKVKVVLLEAQAVLASSGNPTITNPSMPWEPSDNPSISNPSMPWGAQQRKAAPWTNEE